MIQPAAVIYFLTSAISTPFFIANQSLVNTLFVMLANDREKKDSASMFLRVWPQPCQTQPTHSHIRVVSTLFMELQRKHLAIAASNALLPPWPMNDRQFHAARYRRGQLHILEANIKLLKRELLTANSAKTRLVRLEDILAPSTTKAPNRLRAAIHHVLRTRNAGKIRIGGYGDLVFTLWLCGSWLSRLEGVQYDCNPFQDILDGWLGSVEKVYGFPPLEANECGSRDGAVTSLTIEGLQKKTSGNGRRDRDELAIAESYLDVVTTISERYSWWNVAHGRWTVEFLRWGLHIVHEEGLIFPGLGGEAGDEFVVFVTSEEWSSLEVQKCVAVPAP